MIPSDGGVLELSHSDKAKDSAERKDKFNGSMVWSVVVDCLLLFLAAARTSRDWWWFLVVVRGANVEGFTQASVVVGKRRVKPPTMIRAAVTAVIIIVVERIGWRRVVWSPEAAGWSNLVLIQRLDGSRFDGSKEQGATRLAWEGGHKMVRWSSCSMEQTVRKISSFLFSVAAVRPSNE
jgi:hypothetical protein